MTNQALFKKAISEAIGTFALVFCGTGAIITNDLSNGSVGTSGIAVSFGLVVMAMIFSFGNVSGAHINPAVSLAFYLNRQLSAKLLVVYMLAQIAGALLASTSLALLFSSHETLGATLPSGSVEQSFFLEIFLTFFLMLVIFKVSSNPSTNHFTAIAVGGVVLFEAWFAGPICGASMNPARSVGPAIISGHVQDLWVYIIAPVSGAVLSIPFHRLTLEKS